jgi:hypothetical protein
VATGNTDTKSGRRKQQPRVNASAPTGRVMQRCNKEYDAERYYCHALKNTQWAWRQL